MMSPAVWTWVQVGYMHDGACLFSAYGVLLTARVGIVACTQDALQSDGCLLRCKDARLANQRQYAIQTRGCLLQCKRLAPCA